MTKRVLAVIPARGGSKDLPRKNILELQGIPLIAWSIKASLNSHYITKTIVSTDDEEISEIAEHNGAFVIKRPKNLSDDTASSVSVARHAIEYLKAHNEVFDDLVFLQPTSPLRTSEDIDNAYQSFMNSDACSLISVVEIDNKCLKSFIKQPQEDYIKAIHDNKYAFTRRQDLPLTYLSNGAIYIVTVPELLKNNNFYAEKTIEYVMDELTSIDIDSQEDLAYAESILKSKDAGK